MPRNETEIKLKVTEARAIKRRILALGYAICEPRHLERNYLFDFSDRRLRKSSYVLRLRREGRRSLLTFKGPPVQSKDYKIRREIETEVADGVRLREILEFMGLQEVFSYEKFRTTYGHGSGRKTHSRGQVVLDETPVGNFVELEGPKHWIDDAAHRLGFKKDEYIRESYVSLYFEKCRLEGMKPGNMTFTGRK